MSSNTLLGPLPAGALELLEVAQLSGFAVAETAIENAGSRYLRMSREPTGELDLMCDRSIWAVGFGVDPRERGYPIPVWASLCGIEVSRTSLDEDVQFLLRNWDKLMSLLAEKGVEQRLLVEARRLSPYLP